jgi:hypothetical protein
MTVDTFDCMHEKNQGLFKFGCNKLSGELIEHLICELFPPTTEPTSEGQPDSSMANE